MSKNTQSPSRSPNEGELVTEPKELLHWYCSYIVGCFADQTPPSRSAYEKAMRIIAKLNQELGTSPNRESPSSASTRDELVKGMLECIDKAARDFVRDWPSETYVKNDLPVFFEQGAMWALRSYPPSLNVPTESPSSALVDDEWLKQKAIELAEYKDERMDWSPPDIFYEWLKMLDLRMVNNQGLHLGVNNTAGSESVSDAEIFDNAKFDERRDLLNSRNTWMQRALCAESRIAELEAEAQEMRLTYVSAVGQTQAALERVAELEEALTFYADPAAYINDETAREYGSVVRDEGERARKALGFDDLDAFYKARDRK